AAANQANCRLIVLRRPAMPASSPAFDRPAALITALADLVPPAVIAKNPAPFSETRDRGFKAIR
ncbi:MAG: hypothetical protein AAB112_01605, partial [Thermodesulfobacteriota bacterium]